MINSKFGYDIVHSLIYYSNGTDFSPNNIKRLVISPEGVAVWYYVNKKFAYKFFSILDYMKSSGSQDYKPILSILYAERQLTSIEEIIILPTGSNRQNCLNPLEMEASVLIGKRGATSLDGAKSSYKRLRYFTIAYNMDFKTFLGNYTKAVNEKLGRDFISDCDFMCDAQKNEIHSDTEYYMQDGISITSRTLYPIMDGENGTLSSYFKKVKQDKLTRIKKEEIAKHSEETNKKANSELESVLKKYKGYYKCASRLYGVALKQGYNILVDSQCGFKPTKLTLKKCKLLEDETIFNIEDCSSEKSAINYNIKVLSDGYKILYVTIVKDFLTKLVSIARVRKLTAKALVESSDNVIAIVTNELQALNSEIQEICGKSYKGQNIDDSMANVCSLYVKFFITNVGETNVDKLKTKSTWKEVL